MQVNKIYNQDCLEGLGLLDNECIDLTVTSPPYDNLRLYNGYYFKFEEIANELYRVMKPGGVIAWIVGDKTKNGSETGTSFRQALYFKDIGFNLHDTMIYEKNNPTPQKSNRYQPCFEYMFILSKGKPKTFNPIMIEKKYIESRPNKMYNKDKSGMQIQHQYSSSSNLKIKNNIWKYNVGLYHSTNDKEAFKHPAIFPEQLAADHILSWSNEGDIILDPFMGSGTVAKMALINKRKFIGFEISTEYCKLAKERISKYV
mgnify:FL=1|jgi:site-specific DNA-methyltransferase (adenine-specific)